MGGSSHDTTLRNGTTQRTSATSPHCRTLSPKTSKPKQSSSIVASSNPDRFVSSTSSSCHDLSHTVSCGANLCSAPFAQQIRTFRDSLVIAGLSTVVFLDGVHLACVQARAAQCGSRVEGAGYASFTTVLGLLIGLSLAEQSLLGLIDLHFCVCCFFL